MKTTVYWRMGAVYWRMGAACAILLAHGCAVLPNTVNAELEHVSHASQHFGPHPTNYGYDAVSVTARWRVTRAVYVELSEGRVLEPCRGNACGGLYGPREVFTGRVGYTFQVRP